jgi:hypothetical protein
MCSWSTFGAQMNNEHTRMHKTHHGPNLGEVTTFPLIVFTMGTTPKWCFSRDSQVGIPKIPKIRIPIMLDTHNFFYKPSIEVKSQAKL